MLCLVWCVNDEKKGCVMSGVVCGLAGSCVGL